VYLGWNKRSRIIKVPYPKTFTLFTRKLKMEDTFNRTAIETIDLLETRLRRIEYALRGTAAVNSVNKDPATKRLADLEHFLHQLASKSRVVQELLRLRESCCYGLNSMY